MNSQPKEPEEKSGLEIHILGIGEITTTIEVKGRHWGKIHPTEHRWMKVCYKRMPPMASKENAKQYIKSHIEYQDLLRAIGIDTPWYKNLLKQRQDGNWIVYNQQERLDTAKVACLVIHDIDKRKNIELFRLFLKKLEAIFIHNLKHPDKLVGFDAQIPNWVLPYYKPKKPDIKPDEPMVYIDTSTPLLRYEGIEQLDTEIFLKSIPSIFRPIVRLVLLQQILDRYYAPRDILLDLLASYFTHGRPDLVSTLVEEANRFMAESSFAEGASPFSVEEIKKYHREDVVIWKFFRTIKRIDRWISERIFGKKYEQRLPYGSPRKWKNLVGAGGMGLVKDDN